MRTELGGGEDSAAPTPSPSTSQFVPTSKSATIANSVQPGQYLYKGTVYHLFTS